MSTPTRADRVGDLLRSADDERLVRELFADVCAIARSVLGPVDDHLLKTAAHDALLAVVRYRHGFRGDSRGSTWLYTLTRRESLRAVRRDARLRAVEVFLDPELQERLDHAAVFACPEAALVAHELLEELVPNPDWRRIWLLFHDPDRRRSHAEVARLTGRTEGTVAVTLSRVRGRLGKGP